MMQHLKPIYWRHGVFLQPHHFQYADIYTQNILWRSTQLSLVPPWGVVKLIINQDKLTQGTVEFNVLDFIFEDGTRVNIENNTVVGNFRFNPRKISSEKTGYKIYIGIKKLIEGQANVTRVDKSNDLGKVETRFINLIDDDLKHNLYEGGEMAQLEHINYVLQIFDEDSIKNAQGFSIIPILKLIRHEDQIIVDETYVPPLVASAGCHFFVSLIDSIYAMIQDRTKQLELYKMESFMQEAYDGKHQKESRLASGYRMALQTLARYLMEFSVDRQSHNLHPWYLYKLCSCMISELSLFSAKVDVHGSFVDDVNRSLPNYNHNDLYKTFAGIKNLLKLLLDDISLQPEMFIELKPDKANRFGVMVPDNFFNLGQEFYLGIVTKEPLHKCLEDFIHFAKIASESMVEELSSHALPGLKLVYMQERPQGIPNRPNTTYFKLVRNGYAWESIQRTRSLVVLWDSRPQDCQMNLSVIKE